MKYRSPRSGFTLVEVMVAAALSLVIMTLLAMAFGSSMKLFSELKSTGDLAERLRTAEVTLRGDLDSEHFLSDDASAPIRASDLKYDAVPATPVPKGGYVRFSGITGVWEGIDADNIASTRSNGATDSVAMTIKRTSRSTADLFASNTPTMAGFKATDALTGATFNSQWAEVKWQLGNPVSIGGVTTYSLHRSVRLLTTSSNPIQGNGLSDTMSVSPSGTVNTPQSLALASNRPALLPFAAGTPLYGDDIVLTNVLSFEVKPYQVRNNSAIAVLSTSNGDYPFESGTFDSAVPAGNRLVAVMVKIRIFDSKNRLTRQTCLIVKQ